MTKIPGGRGNNHGLSSVLPYAIRIMWFRIKLRRALIFDSRSQRSDLNLSAEEGKEGTLVRRVPRTGLDNEENDPGKEKKCPEAWHGCSEKQLSIFSTETAATGFPGTLHHVRGRGIEAKRISRTKKDRGDFVDRLAELSRSGRWAVNAWALMQFVSSIRKKE